MSSFKNIAKRTALSIALPFLIIGCSSSHFGAAHITSAPAGAEIINIDSGTTLGVTPANVFWEAKSDQKQFINVRLRKAGFYNKLATFWLSMRHSSSEEALKNAQKVEVNLLPKPQ